MPAWSMDNWQYVEREVVTDPKGRKWTVALMDVLGQQGDPDRPDALVELQYSSGRYFTLVTGTLEAGCSVSAVINRSKRRVTRIATCS